MKLGRSGGAGRPLRETLVSEANSALNICTLYANFPGVPGDFWGHAEAHSGVDNF